MARQKSELELELDREYRNYLARYRRAVKKYGAENVPEKIPRPKAETVTPEDIGIIERQRAGVFEEAYQRKQDIKTNEPIPASIPDEVIKIIDRLRSIREEFKFEATKVLYDSWFGNIETTYTQYQIAYIYLKNVDEIEYWVEYILQYEDGNDTNPKVLSAISRLSTLFNTRYPSELEAMEYFGSTKEFYDAGYDEEWQDGDEGDIFL